jgi:very-short-patch-repair endonuclease
MDSLTPYARSLRKNQTEAERRLWRELRQRAIGVRFRRQAPIGPYIVDFVSFERKLVIELDGGQHLENPKDEIRDAWLTQSGLRVLRFWNNEVLANTEGVMTVILRALGLPT